MERQLFEVCSSKEENTIPINYILTQVRQIYSIHSPKGQKELCSAKVVDVTEYFKGYIDAYVLQCYDMPILQSSSSGEGELYASFC